MNNLMDYYEHADDHAPLFANVKFVNVGLFKRSWVLKDVPFELLTSKAMLEHIRQMSLTSSKILIGDFLSERYYSNGDIIGIDYNTRVATIFDGISQSKIGFMEITITDESFEDMRECGEFKDMPIKN